ncbi:MAG: T9SS type A sorting domain-containing protein [Flavobacterium sp.]
MKKIYCLLGFALLSLSTGFAQENHLRNSKWFAYNTQLQFTPYNPYAYPQDTPNPFSGFVTASVCDPNGDPLIVVNSYNGTVWANDQIIGNIPSAINTQNTIIVPKPKHSDRYYIISSTEWELNYTEVDLTTLTLINQEASIKDQNGNPILSSPGGSGVASTVHANGIDYWITAFANDTLMSYQLTENGINTIPISASTLPSSEVGASLKIKISPKSSYDNKKHIAIVNFYNGTSLKDFNDETGAITDSYSNINYALEQRNLNNFNNIIHTVDAEFSADGNTLYCVDDINNYGSVYAIQESGSILPIGEYGSFVSSRRGPDGSVYFLDGYGSLHKQQPDSTNYPNYLGISLFYNGSFNQWAYLPQLVSFNECLTLPANIPAFSPTYICKGASYTLPATSNNGITGSWSPAFNNMATTTYTFTPDQGQCAAETANLTVVVNDQNTIPVFNTWPLYLPSSLCVGSSYTFPTTSSNQITGTWSPAFNNTATTTYTFTPNAGQCGATTTHTITIDQKATPAFNSIAPICTGSTFTLPTTSTNGITGNWSPAKNYTETTTYTFTPYSSYCATTTAMTVTVNQKVTPTFSAVEPICPGSTINPLPASSANGIAGTWSPAFNNTTNTTYTFTPNSGQCVNTSTTTMTVAVKTVPVFNNIATIEYGLNGYTLPYESANGINGTWNPASVAEGKNNYTFTPDSGDCPITKSFTFVKQKTISAVYDDFSATPINGDSGGITPSVFANDYSIDGGVVSNNNVIGTIVSINPSASFYMYPDGTIFIEGNGRRDYGTYVVEYKITQRSCPENYDTSFATIVLTDPNATGRKSNNIAQKTSEVLTVYPNPSNGIYNIDLTSVKGDYDTVRVFSMLGSLIYESNLNSKSTNQIDLSHVATGCYIAKVSGNSGGTSFQLIKQ